MWEVAALPEGAASTGIVYPLPGGEYTRLGALSFVLSTAAGGGNRQVIVQLVDGTGATVFAVAAPGVQAGGLTVGYSFAPLVPAAGSSALGFQTGPLAGGWLPTNVSVEVQVTSAAAGDVLTSGRLLVGQHPVQPDV